jgi:hypothetical protein
MNMGQFFGVIGRASNIVPNNISVYTVEMFMEDFPQFTNQNNTVDPPTYTSLIPQTILAQFIEMANNAIQEARWFTKWRYAMGLFIAHYATLYLRAYSDGSPNAQTAAASGTVLGPVKSAALGNSNVSYDTTAVVKATEEWGAWNSTTYGQMLVTEARLVGMGGSFII